MRLLLRMVVYGEGLNRAVMYEVGRVVSQIECDHGSINSAGCRYFILCVLSGDGFSSAKCCRTFFVMPVVWLVVY